MNELINH